MRCECEKGKGKFPLQRSLKTRSALAVVDVAYGFSDKVLIISRNHMSFWLTNLSSSYWCNWLLISVGSLVDVSLKAASPYLTSGVKVLWCVCVPNPDCWRQRKLVSSSEIARAAGLSFFKAATDATGYRYWLIALWKLWVFPWCQEWKFDFFSYLVRILDSHK